MGVRESLERQDRSAEGSRERESLPLAEAKLPLYEVRKCPYLAGRPPCGSHHLFPSGANVCWAAAGEAKPYHAISRDTQDRHCFGGGGPGGQDGCGRYRKAVAAGLPLPQFERPPADAPSGPKRALPPRRKPRRRAKRGTSRLMLMSHAAWLVPLGL